MYERKVDSTVNVSLINIFFNKTFIQNIRKKIFQIIDNNYRNNQTG